MVDEGLELAEVDIVAGGEEARPGAQHLDIGFQTPLDRGVGLVDQGVEAELGAGLAPLVERRGDEDGGRQAGERHQHRQGLGRPGAHPRDRPFKESGRQTPAPIHARQEA